MHWLHGLILKSHKKLYRKVKRQDHNLRLCEKMKDIEFLQNDPDIFLAKQT